MKKIILLTTMIFSILSADTVNSIEANINLDKTGTTKITQSIKYTFDMERKHNVTFKIPTLIKQKDIDLKIEEITVDKIPAKYAQKQEGEFKKIEVVLPEDLAYDTELTNTFTLDYSINKSLFSSNDNGTYLDLILATISSSDSLTTDNYKINISFPENIKKDEITLELTSPEGAGDDVVWSDEKHASIEIIYLDLDDKVEIKSYFDNPSFTIPPYRVKEDKTTMRYKKTGDFSLSEREKQTERLSDANHYPVAAKHIKKKRELSKSDYYELLENSSVIIFIIFLITYLFMYRRVIFRKREKINIVKTPPKNLSILDAGLILDKTADLYDYSIEIINLATLGHIIIDFDRREEKKRAKKEGKKKGFIKKMAEYLNVSYPPILHKTDKSLSGLDYNQKELMRLLFKDGDILDLYFWNTDDSKDEIMNKLKHQWELERKIKNFNKEVYETAVDKDYFEENPRTAKIRAALVGIGFLVPLFLVNSILYDLFPLIILSMLYSGLLYASVRTLFLHNSLGGNKYRRRVKNSSNSIFHSLYRYLIREQRIRNITTSIVFLGVSVGILYAAVISFDLTMIEALLSPVGISGIMISIIAVVALKAGAYTDKGYKIRNELLGLKKYLKKTGAEELIREIGTDEDYLDNLLPYAILFDLDEKFFYVYGELSRQPKWFKGGLDELEITPIIISESLLPQYVKNKRGLEDNTDYSIDI